MSTATIYALYDPRTDQPRYVGRTLQPLILRLQQHHSECLRHITCPRTVWLAELRDAGLRAYIVEIEIVNRADMHEREKFWVDYFRKQGTPLLNEAPPGGGGTWSYIVEWTPELEARLGVESDAAIAEDLGVTRKAVSYRRRVLGIQAGFSRTRARKEKQKRPRPPAWNKKTLPATCIALLGFFPDYVLAEQYGTHKKRIMQERRKLGIPSCAETTGNNGRFTDGHKISRWNKRG